MAVRRSRAEHAAAVYVLGANSVDRADSPLHFAAAQGLSLDGQGFSVRRVFGSVAECGLRGIVSARFQRSRASTWAISRLAICVHPGRTSPTLPLPDAYIL